MLFSYCIPYFQKCPMLFSYETDKNAHEKKIYKTDLEVFISEVFKYTILFKYINPLCYTYIIKIRRNFVF